MLLWDAPVRSAVSLQRCAGRARHKPAKGCTVSLHHHCKDAALRGWTPSEYEDNVPARVERECAKQGIPVAIEDPVTVAKILTLVRDGRASKSATKTATSARRGRPSACAKG
jgi:hypothetical protein